MTRYCPFLQVYKRCSWSLATPNAHHPLHDDKIYDLVAIRAGVILQGMNPTRYDVCFERRMSRMQTCECALWSSLPMEQLSDNWPWIWKPSASVHSSGPAIGRQARARRRTMPTKVMQPRKFTELAQPLPELYKSGTQPTRS